MVCIFCYTRGYRCRVYTSVSAETMSIEPINLEEILAKLNVKPEVKPVYNPPGHHFKCFKCGSELTQAIDGLRCYTCLPKPATMPNTVTAVEQLTQVTGVSAEFAGALIGDLPADLHLPDNVAELFTAPVEAPDTLDAQKSNLTLRKYQIEGINKLRELKKALLWDAPGLGKTVQALEAAEKPILVAAPTYLTEQWYDVVINQFPDYTVRYANGSRSNKEDALADDSADVTIINIEMLRPPHITTTGRMTGFRIPRRFKTLIIDEAHHIRNREAAQSKGAYSLAQSCERVLLLSATPMYKSVEDIFYLLHILDPKEFSSYWKFMQEFAYMDNYSKVLKVRNPAKLRELMSRYGIGRSYADVKLELPPLIRNDVAIRADDAFMKQYREIKRTFVFNDKDIQSMMEAAHLLRRLTAKAKLQHALEIMDDMGEGILFCWYKSTANAIATLLNLPCIDGDTPPDERKKIAKDSKFMVATIAALSEGVDLSHLNNVIFFETDWVPGKLHQALSRVRRLRPSLDPVRVTFIYVKDTIDEIVFASAMGRNMSIREVMKAALIED